MLWCQWWPVLPRVKPVWLWLNQGGMVHVRKGMLVMRGDEVGTDELCQSGREVLFRRWWEVVPVEKWNGREVVAVGKCLWLVELNENGGRAVEPVLVTADRGLG